MLHHRLPQMLSSLLLYNYLFLHQSQSSLHLLHLSELFELVPPQYLFQMILSDLSVHLPDLSLICSMWSNLWKSNLPSLHRMLPQMLSSFLLYSCRYLPRLQVLLHRLHLSMLPVPVLSQYLPQISLSDPPELVSILPLICSALSRL